MHVPAAFDGGSRDADGFAVLDHRLSLRDGFASNLVTHRDVGLSRDGRDTATTPYAHSLAHVYIAQNSRDIVLLCQTECIDWGRGHGQDQFFFKGPGHND